MPAKIKPFNTAARLPVMVNDAQKMGRALLRESSRRDASLSRCRRFINNGADVNYSEDETTPLIYAAAHGHAEIANLLLLKGAHIDPVDNQGRNAESWASSGSHRAIVRMINTVKEKQAREKETAAKMAAIDKIAHSGTDEEIKTPPIPVFTKKPFNPGGGA